MALEMHQRIIRDITRTMLKPAGLTQSGTSRLWYDDCGWFVSFAEFQPHAGRKGSCLNLGATWLWYPRDGWAFDINTRATAFVECEDEAQFESAITAMADSAIAHCRGMRATLTTPGDAFDLVQQGPVTGWTTLSLAVLAGLTDQRELALELFRRILATEATWPWEHERNAYAQNLIDCLVRGQDVTGQNFRDRIAAHMRKNRSVLKLSEWPDPLLP